jgi:thioredoxin 1
MRTAKYFTATWCGPCKAFKPIILELISEGYNITIHDVDENQELASKYGVRSIPTMVIEENGVEVDRFIGALPKETVKEKLS